MRSWAQVYGKPYLMGKRKIEKRTKEVLPYIYSLNHGMLVNSPNFQETIRAAVTLSNCVCNMYVLKIKKHNMSTALCWNT